MQSVKFVTEQDLRELGFNMGPRKLIIEWLKGSGVVATEEIIQQASQDSSLVPLLSSTLLDCPLLQIEPVGVL